MNPSLVLSAIWGKLREAILRIGGEEKARLFAARPGDEPKHFRLDELFKKATTEDGGVRWKALSPGHGDVALPSGVAPRDADMWMAVDTSTPTLPGRGTLLHGKAYVGATQSDHLNGARLLGQFRGAPHAPSSTIDYAGRHRQPTKSRSR